MKTLLGALAVTMLLGAATAAPASAACWWNGWSRVCGHPYWHHHWHPWHHGDWHHWHR